VLFCFANDKIVQLKSKQEQNKAIIKYIYYITSMHPVELVFPLCQLMLDEQPTLFRDAVWITMQPCMTIGLLSTLI